MNKAIALYTSFGKKLLIPFTIMIAVCFTVISCDRDLSISEPYPPVPQAKLVIDSNPQGAKIFINRDNTGKITPDSIVNLPADNYKILLKRELFYDTSVSVNLQTDEDKLVYIDYFGDPNNFAKIDCITEPEHALIFLNDSCTNLYTPNSLEFLMPGIYEVKYTYPEHRADSVTYTLRTRDRIVSNIELQDTTVWVDYNASNSDYPNAYLTLCAAIDKDDVKWFGTRDKGVVRYDDKEWQVFNWLNSGLQSNTINDIAVDEENTKYFGTNMGLATYDGVEWKVLRNISELDLTIGFVELILLKNKSDIWMKVRPFRASYQVLIHFDGSTWSKLDYGKEVATMAIDKKGIIWCGYDRDLDDLDCGYDRGIEVFDGSAWTDITQQGSILYRKAIKSILRDKYDKLWIVGSSDYNGGVYNADGIDNITEVKFYNFRLYNMHIADNDNKWVSAAKSIIKLGPNNEETIFTLDNTSLLNNQPQKIVTQSNGDVWITTFLRGVIKFKGGNLMN